MKLFMTSSPMGAWDGIVMGISAGNMNCAELHYQAVKEDLVDGLRLMEDITYPDSYGHSFLAIPDGTYVLQTEDRKEVRGEAYLIEEGQIRRICENGGTAAL